MASVDPLHLWDELSGILLRSEESYCGEGISQLEHALQTARLANEAAASSDEVVAALFHDVGHMIEGADSKSELGALEHEEIGARFLAERGFGPSVVSLVRGHVEAKRYLTWRDRRYREMLSDASQRTLELQGGPMTDEEADEFGRNPSFRARLRLRSWDDRAKIEGLKVAGVAEYRDVVLEHFSRPR